MKIKLLSESVKSQRGRVWVAPTVQKIRAGDAENGPNANATDGGFSSGGS